MDINNKKTAKQLIKLACSIGFASKTDLMILYAMVDLKIWQTDISVEQMNELQKQIANNPHLMALMKIKDKS